MIEIRLLGRLQVLVDGVPVALGAQRESALLVRLALAADRTVRRDALIADLWEDAPPASAANKIQIWVSDLRKRLGRGVIRTVPDGYTLGRDVAVDASDWRRIVKQGLALADDGDGIAALAAFSLAEQEWGEPFAELPETVALRAERASLVALRLDAAVRQAALRIEQGHLATVIADLGDLAEQHPTHEGLLAQLMLATAATGRRLDALHLYDRTRRALVDDYGLDPGPALAAAHARILRDDVPVPSITARPAVRLGLPHLPDAMIGREEVLSDLLAMLSEPRNRLVTVTGMGGVGKTRLGQAVVERHPAAAWVTLQAAQRPGDVVEAIASQLGVDAVGGSSEEQVVATLAVAPTGLVLVLDDFEHVLGAAPFLERLLLEAPGLTVLVTSRVPLGLAAERLLPLAPLSVEAAAGSAAVELLVDHLARHGIADADEEMAVELVRLCGGLPLAIELAAAQARVRTLEEVRDRLTTSLLEPGAGSPVAAAIRWSVEALPAPVRRTWFAAATFAGGCTAEALAAVAGTASDLVLDDLAHLLDHSLIRTERTPAAVRFVLLPVVARLALAMLGPVEEARMRDAHAAWFARLVGVHRPSEYFPTTLAQLAVLAADRANIRAAVRHLSAAAGPAAVAPMVVELSTPWRVFGEGAEMLAWIDTLLAADGIGPELRSDLLVVRDRTTGLAGGAEGDRLLAVASDLLGDGADPERAAVVLLQQGYHALLGGDLAGAQRLLARLEPLVASVHPSLRAGVAQLAAMVEAGRGDIEAAATHLRAVHADARERGYDFLELELVGNLAEVLITAGRYEESIVVALEGLALSRPDDRFTRTTLLARIALARSLDGRITLAGAAMRTALALAADTTWTRDKLGLLLVAAADLAFGAGGAKDAAYLLGVWQAGLAALGVEPSPGERQLVDRYLARFDPEGGPHTGAVAEGHTAVVESGAAAVAEQAVQALLDRRSVRPATPALVGRTSAG